MLALALALIARSEAHSTGQTGVSTIGCTCHGALAAASTTVSFTGPTATVLPGESVPITLTVASSNATRIAGGLNVSATAGTFLAGSNNKLSGGQITHASPQLFTAGAVTFDFTWVAPATEGTYTLHGAGNAVNLNGFSSGDGWNFAPDLVIVVDNGCDDVDFDGVDGCSGDCDDNDPAINPFEPDVCDGIDNDCTGYADDNAVDAGEWFPDADLDGYGGGDGEILCTQPFGTIDQGGDCDDGNASIHPGAVEVCDPVDADQDCNGYADDATAIDAVAWYPDEDLDGYGAGTPVVDCEAPVGSVALGGDCDDASSAFNPGVVETDCADPTDYNCDGSSGFVDNDLDGWAACEECNDASPGAFPGATELCDGIDNDCDTATDEGDAADASTWYVDQDLDGHGVPTAHQTACTAPDGFVALSDDCDDGSATVFPGAAEQWYDGIDQNCDGNDADQDLDGVALGEDCVDTDAAVHPGATEVPYDGVDQDCNGLSDFDMDTDGHDAAPPDGEGDDCDDLNSAVYPGADDPACDGIDLDCDPGPDNDPTCAPTTTPGGGDSGGLSGGAPKPACDCEHGPASIAPFAPLLAILLRRRRGGIACPTPSPPHRGRGSG